MARVERGDGGGAGRRENLPRSGASPERPEIGHPGVESTGFWVGRTPRIIRDPLGGFQGSGRLCWGSPRRGAELGGGARRRGVLCGRGCATGYAILHKRTRRLMRCSPGSETKEGSVGGELRRRVAGGARWWGTVVELQASGLPGSTPGRAVRVKRGLGWSGSRRRHGNRGGRATYRRCVPGEIPGAA